MDTRMPNPIKSYPDLLAYIRGTYSDPAVQRLVICRAIDQWCRTNAWPYSGELDTFAEDDRARMRRLSRLGPDEIIIGMYPPQAR